MPDKINDVLVYTALNLNISVGGSFVSEVVDLSWAGNGVIVSWNFVDKFIPQTTSSNISVEESDDLAGPFTVVPSNRLIGSEFFIKQFVSRYD